MSCLRCLTLARRGQQKSSASFSTTRNFPSRDRQSLKSWNTSTTGAQEVLASADGTTNISHECLSCIAADTCCIFFARLAVRLTRTSEPLEMKDVQQLPTSSWFVSHTTWSPSSSPATTKAKHHIAWPEFIIRYPYAITRNVLGCGMSVRL